MVRPSRPVRCLRTLLLHEMLEHLRGRQPLFLVYYCFEESSCHYLSSWLYVVTPKFTNIKRADNLTMTHLILESENSNLTNAFLHRARRTELTMCLVFISSSFSALLERSLPCLACNELAFKADASPDKRAHCNYHRGNDSNPAALSALGSVAKILT